MELDNLPNSDITQAISEQTTDITTPNTAESTTVEAGATGESANAEGTNSSEQTPSTPSVPKAYDFTKFVGEGGTIDEANATAFSEVLRSLNINQEGAEKLTTFGMGYLQQMGEAMLDHIEQVQDQQSETWKQETVQALGGNFDATIVKAGAGIEYLEKQIPNLREVLSYNGIGNNLALVKAFSILGDLVAEDTGKLGGNATGGGLGNFYDKTDWNRYK